MKTIKVKLTFTEPLLGTWPANERGPRVHRIQGPRRFHHRG